MKSGTLSDKIARFLFAYRNTPHSTTGTTPAELLMGHKLRSPLDLLKPDLHIRVEEKQEKQKQYHDRIAHQRSFAVGDLVFIRNFSRSSTDQWIPGEVISTTGPRSFRVKVPDGRILRRHIDHIRIRTAPLSQKESEVGGQSSAPGDDLEFPRRSFSTDPDMDSPTVPQGASASLSPSNVHCPPTATAPQDMSAASVPSPSNVHPSRRPRTLPTVPPHRTPSSRNRHGPNYCAPLISHSKH